MNFQEIHSYYKTLAIADFFADIVTEGEEVILAANKKWRPESGYIYFCTEGSLSILMPDDGLSIGNSIEYMPIGLMERYCPLAKFEYTGSGPVTLRKITYAVFDRLFIENHPQRVEALAKVLVFMSIFTIDLHNERRQVTSYQTIRPMLYRYLYRQHTHEGENEGLALFIIRRTNLSRTHVFRVLADLKAGGYITMKRGKLISIDRPLPADY
ncbi:helix-turn-helix domain-containing protein [Klebsiella pneumoniae]|uniref:helix-turn-helix domain-containing protein n=1 Tax=Klebsiella pneumoniae TaxID=573 RepID=UPI000E1FE271|nr:helix-turn-helix domain-containing protein [Klebsiella pneumoniae]ELA1021396.1 helix-turn-helix domain-containing protein [Klebsiella pneumoniae]MBE3227197.1 helix-turn-helix domain-containing protein [Klebsiella pneumoniae]HBX4891937.1 Crp/Fnr family transcriptional regulator [Klebsiella pneumoniae]HBX5533199.1 Crp/Fnr family transcriptional regulator [Klebsiella pneumoniae]HCB8969977.1 helix-turn-helix domain-containing protein [Klebsiella pneumoniae]